MQEREDNAQFVDRLMNFSKCGPIMQLFIMNALDKAATRVASTPLPELRKAFGENNFINPDAWHAAACELKGELNKRLGA